MILEKDNYQVIKLDNDHLPPLRKSFVICLKIFQEPFFFIIGQIFFIGFQEPARLRASAARTEEAQTALVLLGLGFAVCSFSFLL